MSHWQWSRFTEGEELYMYIHVCMYTCTLSTQHKEDYVAIIYIYMCCNTLCSRQVYILSELTNHIIIQHQGKGHNTTCHNNMHISIYRYNSQFNPHLARQQ